MQTKQVNTNGVCFEVHTETGLDVIRKRALLGKVYNPDAPDSEAEFTAWYEFIDAYVQSKNVSVPFEWPSYTADPEKLLTTRDAWLSLSGDVYRAWKEALLEVNTPPGSDADLLPPEELTLEKKETPVSQPNETVTDPA